MLLDSSGCTKKAKSSLGSTENPYFEKLADFSCVMWICGGFAPCGPSALLATKKSLIRNKDMPFGNPPYHRTKTAKKNIKSIYIYILPFMGQKVVFWGQNTVLLGVLDRVWGSMPETKTEINRNGPKKQDSIVNITHRWPWRRPRLHVWIWPLYLWIWPYVPYSTDHSEVWGFP